MAPARSTLLLLCWFVAIASPCKAQTYVQGQTPATEQRITDLGAKIEPRLLIRPRGAPWDYEVRIGLPRSYDANDRAYPVLWVTDGSVHFEDALSVVTGSNGPGARLPEMIVVAIGTPREFTREFMRRRTYDFSSKTQGTCIYNGPGAELFARECQAYERVLRSLSSDVRLGGASSFLKFIVDELRPEIARRYRIADNHTLWGYSAGGKFCVYALLSRPQAFTKYICGSPAVNAENQSVFALEETYARTHTDLKARVFLSAGEDEILAGGLTSAVGTVSGMARLAEILRLRDYPSLELHTRILPNYLHTPQGAAASLYAGLHTLAATAPGTGSPSSRP